MKIFQRVIFSLLFIGCFTSVSEARTWQVSKDGSGDFSVIQDAVDAAESGDEIQIGPGRFDDFSIIHESGTLYWDVYVRVVGKSLSFVGSGVGQTIIGPEDSSVNENNAYGLSCVEGPSTISVSGISFENLSYRGIWLMYGHLDVDNCSFRNGYSGIHAMASEGAVVTNCHFENFEYVCIGGTSPTTGFLVDNCTFDTVYAGTAFYGSGTSDCQVINCSMLGRGIGRTGALFYDGASGSISNCSFSDFTP